jgi:hypothetical protein
MNRFVAHTPDGRTSLTRAAIEAHRARDSTALTLEADPDRDTEGPPPWIQYRDPDGLLNLDCTDAELPAIRSVVDATGGVTIAAQESVPEGGTNLRLRVRGDDERTAMIVERLFLEGFGCAEHVPVWAAQV